MQSLFFQNDASLILALIIGFTCVSTLIVLIFISQKFKPTLIQFEGVVAPFFSLPAVLFSLTAALLATSIWDNYSVAIKAIKNESQGILNIISLANSVEPFQKTNLSVLAKDYTKSIVDDEWQALSKNRSASKTTEEKFNAMRSEIFKAANLISDKAESKALLNAFFTINTARETRLAYASFDIHPIRWYAILFLGVLALVTVAFIHLNKPKTLIVAMFIATLTILTPLCMIALTFSSPYEGVIAISKTPYLQIIK